jgi:hypothetical protein
MERCLKGKGTGAEAAIFAGEMSMAGRAVNPLFFEGILKTH